MGYWVRGSRTQEVKVLWFICWHAAMSSAKNENNFDDHAKSSQDSAAWEIRETMLKSTMMTYRIRGEISIRSLSARWHACANDPSPSVWWHLITISNRSLLNLVVRRAAVLELKIDFLKAHGILNLLSTDESASETACVWHLHNMQLLDALQLDLIRFMVMLDPL